MRKYVWNAREKHQWDILTFNFFPDLVIPGRKICNKWDNSKPWSIFLGPLSHWQCLRRKDTNCAIYIFWICNDKFTFQLKAFVDLRPCNNSDLFRLVSCISPHPYTSKEALGDKKSNTEFVPNNRLPPGPYPHLTPNETTVLLYI